MYKECIFNPRVIADSILVCHACQTDDVPNGFITKPYFSVVWESGLGLDLNFASIYAYFQALKGVFDSFHKILVSNEVNAGCSIEYQHFLKLFFDWTVLSWDLWRLKQISQLPLIGFWSSFSSSVFLTEHPKPHKNKQANSTVALKRLIFVCVNCTFKPDP